MQTTYKVAVVGASGYAGEELITRLLGHGGVELVCLTSRQYAGKTLAEIYPRLAKVARGSTAPAPTFVAPDAPTILATGATVAFLALPHGLASEFALPLLDAGLRVIDLSADFRLRDAATYHEFYGHEHPASTLLAEAVYGLPELPGTARRDPPRPAGGSSGLLSDEHPGTARPLAAGRIARSG